MAALYQRARPTTFAEVVGQEHVKELLASAVQQGRTSHAYLFSGPRGTGKTTSARILAKVLNCEHPVDGEPCCECEACLAVERGTSYDVHELDAASNNKVEDIERIISSVNLGTPGRHKVYILDEVHMLSTSAFNALLKTLEEPPAHVLFDAIKVVRAGDTDEAPRGYADYQVSIDREAVPAGVTLQELI